MLYSAPTAEVRETFHQGTNRRAYEMLGAHPCYENDVKKWHFAVWAPNAKHVSLVGEFNNWDKSKHGMFKQFDGTWEIRVPETELMQNLKEDGFATYKFAVWGADDVWRLKADPFGFFTEPRPNNGSRIYDMGNYKWGDQAWMDKRKAFNPNTSPVNIYEVHAGSWKRHEDGSFLTYTELADELIPYVQDMGYTHIELLPVMEHPLDMSWGYQVTGFFSATSRYGTPDGLRAFIDRCHQANIGVILDWVPAHFPRDEVGLYKFDGTDLYNHPDPRRGEIPQWGTMLFDFARGEVCSYLLSSACFWIDLFHADGIRVDAVSSIIYYDFCKEPGQYLPNEYGGRENLDGIAFLKRMNQTLYHDAPGIMMIAEESTSFPMITAPTYIGGLGFGFKWNMGWMNDMLSYVKLDPVYRKYHHDKLTFSLMYAFSENYILPFSHDEVVHGKHSMLDKNPGDIWNKFAGLRALYGYTMAHPGKKLLFMGSEFAHFIEWKFDDQLDWFLLVYERHAPLQKCVKTLNHLYKDTKALHEVDNSWEGFQWIAANDSDNSIVAFIRTDKAGKSIVCITNFTPVFRPVYRLPLPYGGKLNELFNTDRAEFGGSNQYNAYEITAQPGDYNGFPFWADVCVPPLSTVYLTYDKILPPKPPKPVIKTGRAAAAPAAAKAKKAGSSSSPARSKKPAKKATKKAEK